MAAPTTVIGETPLAKARRTLVEAEHAVRQEHAQLAEFHAADQRRAQEARRLQAIINQANDRATIRAAQERQGAVETERTELGKEIAAQELVIVRRQTNVTVATTAIETLRNQAAVLRQRIARDEMDARQLERDIARAEIDVEGWRRGLAGLRQRIEATSRQLLELGMQD